VDGQDTLLQSLEGMKRCYGQGCAGKCEQVLKALRGFEFDDAQSLIRAHDDLLFLRAFPQSAAVAKQADAILRHLQPQVERFLANSNDVEAFDDEAVSGIAGTTITNTWTFELARRLLNRHPRQLSAEWNVDEHYRQMATVLPNCLPLLADDSFVEAEGLPSAISLGWYGASRRWRFRRWCEPACTTALGLTCTGDSMARQPVVPWRGDPFRGSSFMTSHSSCASRYPSARK
jgi:hypothetical protein